MIGTSPALDSLSSISPSFTTQSSDNNNLSDIAARVVAELQNDIQNNLNDDIYDQFYVTQKEEDDPEEDQEEEEKEFEFAVVRTSPSVTADVTTPLRYPLFDRSLLLDDDHDHGHDDESMTSSVVVRRPLRMLFNEERETTTSCSSSESDDLEGVTPGTYCVWKPKDSSSESPDLRKKSNSTGNTSKRWKTFKKLLSRSNSHDGNFGKNDVLSNSMGKKNGSDQKVFKKAENTAKVAGADDEGEPGVMSSVSDDKKSSNRFKSYLSYKQTV
ncbi:hypothetical protein CTI12_AA308260 [Artemisia annua]|uniref:Uncharacterized protein n=1 Tax=Artemisia annua TaxID=35608 RepID=A0A2U1N4Q2_ARTAN|nr:hypothetical protein CTI12_AA308260 [Artemisia annua]